MNELVTLDDAQQQKSVAEARLATLRAKAEAASIERALKLIESPQPVPVPWKEYPAYEEAFGWVGPGDRPYYWTDIEDRTEDRYRPLYENEHDLKRMRAEARKLKALFPVAQGALDALTNYVIGTGGLAITAVPRTKDSEPLVKMVQSAIDRFVEYNSFVGDLDREIHIRSREEGEAFVTLYDEQPDVRVELTEPDAIREPGRKAPLERLAGTSHKINHWWLGVHTTHCLNLKRDDVCRPKGYHAVFDRLGEEWDYLPSERVEHIKRNVGRNGRRGVSDFAVVQRDLELEAKIRRNTAEGAAILAAIVMIREHAEGTPKSSVESFVQGESTTDYEKPTKSGARTTYRQQVQPGTVKDIPAGMKHSVGPLGTLRSPVYIEVAQYLLRIIGARWAMPEYLISADASNNNYASSLVAEAPFVKAREDDQGFYGRHFESLVWKALKLYHSFGVFGKATWEQVKRHVALKVDLPEVASRDPLAMARVNAILNEHGIKSKRTWAAELSLDYDEEQQEIASEPQTPAINPLAAMVPESQLRENCGTGAGGFKSGNTCAGGGGGQSSIEDITVGKQEVKTFVNPPLRQLQAALGKHKELRALIDPETGDIYVWPAMQATHTDFAGVVGIKVPEFASLPYFRDPTRLERNWTIMQSLAAKAREKATVGAESVASLRDPGAPPPLLERQAAVNPARTEQLAQLAINSLIEQARKQ